MINNDSWKEKLNFRIAHEHLHKSAFDAVEDEIDDHDDDGLSAGKNNKNKKAI
jgi:hypothetical protein